MIAQHLELLVEEPSMEAFLEGLLPRLLPSGHTFVVHPFQGKDDLLNKLEARLRGYAHWLPTDWRIVVVVDCDDDECHELKQRLETIVKIAGLRSRSHAGARPWEVVTRIAIEELEAWYFGEWTAVRSAYPRVAAEIPRQNRFRDSDAVTGGTWEAFERVLQRYGYFKTGLRKLEAARTIGMHLSPERSRSHSFLKFYEAITEATVTA
jgi:hypothetical protein